MNLPVTKQFAGVFFSVSLFMCAATEGHLVTVQLQRHLISTSDTDPRCREERTDALDEGDLSGDGALHEQRQPRPGARRARVVVHLLLRAMFSIKPKIQVKTLT